MLPVTGLWRTQCLGLKPVKVLELTAAPCRDSVELNAPQAIPAPPTAGVLAKAAAFWLPLYC